MIENFIILSCFNLANFLLNKAHLKRRNCNISTFMSTKDRWSIFISFIFSWLSVWSFIVSLQIATGLDWPYGLVQMLLSIQIFKEAFINTSLWSLLGHLWSVISSFILKLCSTGRILECSNFINLQRSIVLWWGYLWWIILTRRIHALFLCEIFRQNIAVDIIIFMLLISLLSWRWYRRLILLALLWVL